MRFSHDVGLHAPYPQNFTSIFSVDSYDRDQLSAASKEILGSIDGDHLVSKLDPAIDEWRTIYGKMRARPKYKPSIQVLRDQFGASGALWTISPVVDFYNAYSLKTALPMAAYDKDKISGDLSLRIVESGLPFTPLGNPKAQPIPTKANEVAYVDAERVICRYWNMNDCHETRIESSTKSVLFLFDILASSAVEAQKIARMIGRDFAAYLNAPETEYLVGPGVGFEVDL